MFLKVRIRRPARRGRCTGSGRELRAPRGRLLRGALLLRSGCRLEKDPRAAGLAKGVTLGALVGVLGIGAPQRGALGEAGVEGRAHRGPVRLGILDRVGNDRWRRSSAGIRTRLGPGLGRVEGQRDGEHPAAQQRRQDRTDGARAEGAASRAPDAQARVVGRELGRVRVERRLGRRDLGSGGRHGPFPVCTGRGASPVLRVMRTISWSFCPTRSSAASISRSMT